MLAVWLVDFLVRLPLAFCLCCCQRTPSVLLLLPKLYDGQISGQDMVLLLMLPWTVGAGAIATDGSKPFPASLAAISESWKSSQPRVNIVCVSDLNSDNACKQLDQLNPFSHLIILLFELFESPIRQSHSEQNSSARQQKCQTKSLQRSLSHTLTMSVVFIADGAELREVRAVLNP